MDRFREDTMARPVIWIIGDWQHVDFTAVVLWLQERAICRRFISADEASEAADVSPVQADAAAPASLLLVQARPGQIDAEAVEQLHRRFPLARLVALVGPWCEGELRSGRPLPGVARVSWRNWSSRLATDLGLATGTDAPLPRTASDAERLARSVAALKRRSSAGLLAAVCAGDRDRYESLRDCLTLLGVRSLWQLPSVPLDAAAVDLVLVAGWENWPMAEYGASAVEAMRHKPPHILLLDFPRPPDAQRAQALGAAAIVAEPMLLADLAWALESVLPATAAADSPYQAAV
jgi:hypothetical protein